MTFTIEVPRKNGNRQVLVTTDNYLYVSTPKCASCSIKQSIIKKNLGLDRVHNAHKHLAKAGFLTEPGGHKKWKAAVDRSPFSFCVIRNPYSRLASLWRHLGEQGGVPGFRRFVRRICDLPDVRRNIHCRTQVRVLTASKDPEFMNYYDVVLRMEKLDEQWVSSGVADRTGIPQLFHFHYTPKRHTPAELWTPEIADLVEVSYRSDLQYGGYHRPV